MRDLEGSKNPQSEKFVRFAAGNVFTVKHHPSPVRGVNPRDDVEERSLSGAVWPYQPGNTPLLYRQRSILNGMDTAELFVKVLNIQQLKCNRQKKTARVIPGRSLDV